MTHKARLIASVACIVFMTSACSTTKEKTVVVAPPAPATGTLSRSLEMVDSDGKHYGHVELDPVGGGKVYDSSGRLIGDIVRPERY